MNYIAAKREDSAVGAKEGKECRVVHHREDEVRYGEAQFLVQELRLGHEPLLPQHGKDQTHPAKKIHHTRLDERKHRAKIAPWRFHGKNINL